MSSIVQTLNLRGVKNPEKVDAVGLQPTASIPFLQYEKSLQSEYFQIFCKRTELHPPGLLAGGASAPYKRFHRRRKPWRRGGFADPEH